MYKLISYEKYEFLAAVFRKFTKKIVYLDKNNFLKSISLYLDTFRGKRSFTHISGTDDFEVGLRMIITGVQTYDTSVYNCIADNTKGPLGGKDVRDIYIKVNQ